jgi:hypothetical protein
MNGKGFYILLRRGYGGQGGGKRGDSRAGISELSHAETRRKRGGGLKRLHMVTESKEACPLKSSFDSKPDTEKLNHEILKALEASPFFGYLRRQRRMGICHWEWVEEGKEIERVGGRAGSSGRGFGRAASPSPTVTTRQVSGPRSVIPMARPL